LEEIQEVKEPLNGVCKIPLTIFKYMYKAQEMHERI